MSLVQGHAGTIEKTYQEEENFKKIKNLTFAAVYYVSTNTILNYPYFTLNSDLIFSRYVYEYE